MSAAALPPPSAAERAAAATAAHALRAAIADPATMGAHMAFHVDLARPRRGEWHERWANLPGFARINGRGGRYRHACLPGWEYRQAEIAAEMIPDLETLAERGLRPTESTNATDLHAPEPRPGSRRASSAPSPQMELLR